MQTWNSETQRYLVLLTYWRDYRYKRPVRGTLLDFECDVFLGDFVADGPLDEEQSIGGDWLRRYMDGGVNRKTGEYYFTLPRAERLEAIRAYILGTCDVPDIIFHNHSAHITEA